MITKRQGLIVWFQHMKNIKQLKRHGHMVYTSKKLKYTVLYVDQAEIERVETRLAKLPFVTKVELSCKPFIRTDFESATPDKAKQYDYEYKMGI